MTFDSAAARQTMVDTQVRTNDVTDLTIQEAMRAVPREAYCGPAAHLAYADSEVEYAPGLALLRPRDVGKLLQAIRPRSGERGLAIAAPYAAAVLEHMGLTVSQVGALDAVSGASDVIVCEGGVGQTPVAWIEALAAGGRLGVIERNGAAGVARIYLRTENDIGSRPVFDAAPPILAGLEMRPSFAF
jgi:protein-L-isoaspartate(D-aspartate) O-methyltransferase